LAKKPSFVFDYAAEVHKAIVFTEDAAAMEQIRRTQMKIRSWYQ